MAHLWLQQYEISSVAFLFLQYGRLHDGARRRQLAAISLNWSESSFIWLPLPANQE